MLYSLVEQECCLVQQEPISVLPIPLNKNEGDTRGVGEPIDLRITESTDTGGSLQPCLWSTASKTSATSCVVSLLSSSSLLAADTDLVAP